MFRRWLEFSHHQSRIDFNCFCMYRSRHLAILFLESAGVYCVSVYLNHRRLFRSARSRNSRGKYGHLGMCDIFTSLCLRAICTFISIFLCSRIRILEVCLFSSRLHVYLYRLSAIFCHSRCLYVELCRFLFQCAFILVVA